MSDSDQDERLDALERALRAERAGREEQLAALRDQRADLVRRVLALPGAGGRRGRGESSGEDVGPPATVEEVVDALMAMDLDPPGGPPPDPDPAVLEGAELHVITRFPLDTHTPQALRTALAEPDADLLIVAPEGADVAADALRVAAAATPRAGLLLAVGRPARPEWLGPEGARLLAEYAPAQAVGAVPADVPAFAVRTAALPGPPPARGTTLRPLLTALARTLIAAGHDVVRVPSAVVDGDDAPADAMWDALADEPALFGARAPARRVLVAMPGPEAPTTDAHAAGMRDLLALQRLGVDAEGWVTDSGERPGRAQVVLCGLSSLADAMDAIPAPVPMVCTVDRPLQEEAGSLERAGALLGHPRVVAAPVSQWLRTHLRRTASVRGLIVPMGVDTALFQPGGAEEHDELHVAIFARSRPARLVADVTDALVAALGTGVSVASWGAPGHVLLAEGAPDGPWRSRHLGPLRDSLLSAVLRAADFVVDLVPGDPTGEVALQAMACGAVPVVSAEGAGAELPGVLTAETEAEAAEVVAALAADWRALRAAQRAAVQAAAERSDLAAAVGRYALAVRAADRAARTRT